MARSITYFYINHKSSNNISNAFQMPLFSPKILPFLTNWETRFRSANYIFEMTKYLSTSLKLGELCTAEVINMIRWTASKAINNMFIRPNLRFKIILASAIQTPTSTYTNP